MISPKLLFVDDEPGMQKMVEQHLQLSKENFEIVFAHSGQEAIKILQESEAFDLLITDLKMPEVDGWELINFSQSNYNLKTIIISAFGTVDNFERAFEEQITDFLTKPFKLKKLFESVKKAIDSKQSSCRKIEKVKAVTELDKKIPYNTVARLARELQPSQQVKLISDLLKNFELEQLEAFQIEIPSLKEEVTRNQKQRELAQLKDAQRIAQGFLPLTLVADSWIEERWETKTTVSGQERRYLYYFIKWKEGKRLRSKSLRREDLADPEIRAIVERKLGKPIDPSFEKF
ncbi:hypothetical protein C7H19_15310 [Aphanothece hegewaldii CCALA 016]|uniref:Response regulatory domain-containing protein n=1 Tax=Aphanothece hegewaldii CCALA 016 TaxID=2107694 RepID=A0A2T1LVM8_9CHRO|nr:response regulator [Aphanothece hegewaldii]PSF35791.1 hypothetical protein C7H19_15310 [Aphanothece hegewaldii CCALA 016]